MLGLASAGYASVFTNITAIGLWENADNWDDGVPTSTNDANIARYASVLITNSTAEAAIFTLNSGLNNPAGSGGNLTVAFNGILNATSIDGWKNARLWNYGVINLTSYLAGTTSRVEYNNYGTINAGGNLDVGNIFNNSGTFNGATLEGVGHLNLTDGTMTFSNVTFFTAGTMDVSGDGTLIVNATNSTHFATLTNEITTAIAGGQITTDGVAFSGATMETVGTTITLTAVDIPEPPQPVDLNLTNAVNSQWTTGGNWYTNETTDLHGSLPTGIDDVWVTGAMELSGASVTGTANNVSMNQGAVFTITNNATLNAGAVSLLSSGAGANLTVAFDGVLNATSIADSKNSTLYNYGDINLTAGVDVKTQGNFYNYGTIDAADLDMNKSSSFNQMGGTFNAVNLLAGTHASVSQVNLHGGTMTFTDTTAFDTNHLGKLVLDFAGDGEFILNAGTEFANLTNEIALAMAAGYITTDGVADSGATMETVGTTITLTASETPSVDPIGDITMGGLVDGDLVFSWDTSVGQTYNVETNANLTIPSGWGIQDTIIGDGSPVSVTNSTVLDELFYKVTSP